MEYDDLVKSAIDAMQLSKLLYEGTTRTGAAVLTSSNKIFQGAYIAAKIGALCRHAEETAIIHAQLHKEGNIKAIAIVFEKDKGTQNYCSPCGLCREMIYELSDELKKDIDVVMANPNGKYIVKKISELFPSPWIKDSTLQS